MRPGILALTSLHESYVEVAAAGSAAARRDGIAQCMLQPDHSRVNGVPYKWELAAGDYQQKNNAIVPASQRL